MTASAAPFSCTAKRFTAMSHLSDSDHDHCRAVWRDTSASLVTSLEDQGMNTEEVATMGELRVAVVAEYRWRVGL